MTVYVDDMRAKFRRMIMCHMIADSDDELHAMAQAIGVARKWHQTPGKRSHYDICLSMRAEAVKLGATQITLREAAVMSGARRPDGTLPKPDEVPDIIQKRVKRCFADSETG